MTEAFRSSDQADAQRRADVQLAVGRVLGEARTVDDAVPALLPALAEALNWDYAALWLVAWMLQVVFVVVDPGRLFEWFVD